MRSPGDFVMTLLAAMLATGAHGQTEMDAQALRHRLHDALTNTTVTLRLEQTPAREAFGALRAEVGVPLIGRYHDDPVGHGIDPEAPITLTADDGPALEVLEEMLEQCSGPGLQCTWQIRKGFVEFGTKTRLSVPAACETRTYYVADLIVDIPETVDRRTRREVHALDVVASIVETIEPGQWDYGQPLEDEEEFVPSPRLSRGRSQAAAPNPTTRPGQAAPRPRRYIPPRRVAIIRYWRDVLIINAPGYIHRQVGGIPKPIPPR